MQAELDARSQDVIRKESQVMMALQERDSSVQKLQDQEGIGLGYLIKFVGLFVRFVCYTRGAIPKSSSVPPDSIVQYHIYRNKCSLGSINFNCKIGGGA